MVRLGQLARCENLFWPCLDIQVAQPLTPDIWSGGVIVAMPFCSLVQIEGWQNLFFKKLLFFLLGIPTAFKHVF